MLRPCTVLVAVALALACGGDVARTPSGAMRLTLMTIQLQPAFTDFVSGMLSSFEAEHPGTQVEWIDFPVEGYLDKLQMLVMSGEAPDVVNLTFDLGTQTAQQGVLADLREHLAPEVLASYFPRIVESACTSEGRVYAVPWYLAPVVMLVNRSIFEQAGLDPDHPPETFEEQITASRTIHERLPGRFGFFESLTEAGHLRDLLYQQSVPLVATGADGRLHAAFNTEAGVRTLETWASLYRDGVLPRECLTAEHARGIELFKTGTTAMFATGAQFLRQIQEDAPDVYAVCDVAAVPRTPCGITAVDVQILAVTEHGDTPEDQECERRAAELAAFITDADNQLAFCRQVVIFPSVRAAIEDPLFSEDDGTLIGRARVFGARALETAEVFRQVLPESGRLNAAMARAMERACLGEATPADALADAAREWDAILEAP